MKRLSLLIFVALLLSVTAVAQPLPPPLPPLDPALLAQADAQGTVRVVIQFAAQTAGRSPQEAADIVKLTRLGLLANARGGVARLVANSETWTIPYAALEVDRAALQALAATPGVTGISLDAREERHLESALPLVNVDGAHAYGTGLGYTGLTGVGWTIVVIDDGIQADHPFFGGRVVDEACFSTNDAGSSTTSLCPNGQETQFGSGAAATTVCGNACFHGTHVAGIAAGHDDTRSGVAPGANIVAINVFSEDNIGTFTNVSDQIAALQHVLSTVSLNHQVASVNMSLGGGLFSPGTCDSYPGDVIQQARVDAINALTTAGIAVVASSGNSNNVVQGSTTQISRPACITSAIAVSAVADNLTVAFFAHVSTAVDFFAPGVSITSAALGGGTLTSDGTSMAAPFVAGAWAVLKQAAPFTTVSQVRNALAATGIPIDDNRAGGVVDDIPFIQIDDALQHLANQLDNGGMEIVGGPRTPDGWTVAGGAKQKCNKPSKVFTIYGVCAVMLKIDETGLAKLSQSNQSPDAYDSALLSFSVHAYPINVVGGKVMLKIMTALGAKHKLKFNIEATHGWLLYTADLLELDAALTKVTAIASTKSDGKLYVDDVFAVLTPAEIP